MSCAACGGDLAETSRFCPQCGAPADSDALATRTVATPSPRPINKTSAASQGRFAPGHLLGGRYRVISLLGKGGMGEVYRADDLSLEQPVALKFLPESLARNEVAVARFRNEVRVARQVSHPNVCRMYDLGEVEGQYFLSMEFVDGEDLGSLLRRIGRLPSDKAIEIARKLCAGLAAAHEKGVLHRDLKPANVMLDARGQVLLTDFGLAGLAGAIEGAEIRNGTPAYMAPEQLAGEEVTVRSDIYALGLVLYEVFTGKLPFESDTLAGLVRAQREGEPVSPSSLVRDLDPMVERVILRCLQAKPALRPPTALAVAAALPGGDPLAAALAAGETPSPEMVAAAGEGEALAPRVAALLLAAVLIGIGAIMFLRVRTSALEMLQPEYSPDVLAQKARDLVQVLAPDLPKPRDEATGFEWNEKLLDESKAKTGSTNWAAILAAKPPVLHFWYRRSPGTLTGGEIHDDLMTPGMTTRGDPAPILSDMVSLQLDSFGRLLLFERVPPQKQSPPPVATPDWTALFTAAKLDRAQFQPADPQWLPLAAFDTRAAWAGVWPGTQREIRVEAAAWAGKPVYFQIVEPWTRPDRMEMSNDSNSAAVVGMLAVIAVGICVGAFLIARRNLAQGRGDRRGAWRLAAFVFCVHMALWLARTHIASTSAALGLFLLALTTSVFYGVVIWTVYLALEPNVRRRWPQAIMGWSNLLIGRWRDPIVGRDVLIGAVIGVVLTLADSLLDEWMRGRPDWTPDMLPADLLLGGQQALGLLLKQISQSVRESLFFFFLVFLFRVMLRNEWLTCMAFAALFAAFNILTRHSIPSIALSFLVLFGFAYALRRWGLLAAAIGELYAGVLDDAPVTANTSAWYFSSSVLMIGGTIALAVWAFRTSLGGRKIWKPDLLA